MGQFLLAMAVLMLFGFSLGCASVGWKAGRKVGHKLQEADQVKRVETVPRPLSPAERREVEALAAEVDQVEADEFAEFHRE